MEGDYFRKLDLSECVAIDEDVGENAWEYPGEERLVN